VTQVGGIGIAPNGKINCRIGHAIFDATHGIAPKQAEHMNDLGSAIVSGELMLRLVVTRMDRAIQPQSRNEQIREANGRCEEGRVL